MASLRVIRDCFAARQAETLTHGYPQVSIDRTAWQRVRARVVLAYLSQNEAYQDIAEYLATELTGSIPVGLATVSVRRPGMTRLHTENTTGFPPLSDASRDRAPCRHSW